MNIVLLHLMMKFEDLRYLQLLLQQCKNKALIGKRMETIQVDLTISVHSLDAKRIKKDYLRATLLLS